jgi:hypothetical protein
MELLKKNRTLILGVLLIALVFWAYTTFFKQDSSTPTDMNAQAVGSDVLSLYASLQAVTIDQSIFSSPLYRNLVDFSPELQSQPSGRTNPFASIGQD